MAEVLAVGEWQPAMMGLLRRHIGRRIRLTVDHPGTIDGHRARGQYFEGRLDDAGPSDRSQVYVSLAFTEDDGRRRKFDLPLSHPIDVLVVEIPEPPPVDDDTVDALIAEAVRRYEVDPLFHLRARVASRLAERTEYSDLEGAVLVGAVLALVVVDHPGLTG